MAEHVTAATTYRIGEDTIPDDEPGGREEGRRRATAEWTSSLGSKASGFAPPPPGSVPLPGDHQGVAARPTPLEG